MIGKSNMEMDLQGRKLLYAYNFKNCVCMQMHIHAIQPSSRCFFGDCHHCLLFFFLLRESKPTSTSFFSTMLKDCLVIKSNFGNICSAALFLPAFQEEIFKSWMLKYMSGKQGQVIFEASHLCKLVSVT